MAEKKKKQRQIETENKFRISAKVVDRENGLTEYDNIRMVRVVSDTHTLLIMEDFMPVMGEVTKTIELVFENETKLFESIHGFYMHKKNQFYLLIEDYTDKSEEGTQNG